LLSILTKDFDLFYRAYFPMRQACALGSQWRGSEVARQRASQNDHAFASFPWKTFPTTVPLRRQTAASRAEPGMVENSHGDVCCGINMTMRGRWTHQPVTVMLTFLMVLAFAGCTSSSDRTSSSAPARPLPYSFLVDDGTGGTVNLNLHGLVDRGRLTSGYGRRGASGGNRGALHTGIDIAAPTGTPVRASAAGTVVSMRRHASYGRIIRIRHNDRLETAYAHLSRFASRLAVGHAVTQGQIIGYVGTSGRTTGPHLHFEVRRNGKAVDPLGVSVVGTRADQ
jgi:murein DD-endopeptidase MepM/ murein hydrolase activator NlpD